MHPSFQSPLAKEFPPLPRIVQIDKWSRRACAPAVRNDVMAPVARGPSGSQAEPAWRRRHWDSNRARFPAPFPLLPISRCGSTSTRGSCADGRPRGTRHRAARLLASGRTLAASFARCGGVLVLLPLGIIGLFQSARQVVESLRIVRVRLQSQFPMAYGLAGVSLMFEILAQEELRVRIFRVERQQLFEELAGTSQIVILLRGKGEEIKRGRIVGIKAYGLLKLLSRVFILGGFEIEAAQVVVNCRGL